MTGRGRGGGWVRSWPDARGRPAGELAHECLVRVQHEEAGRRILPSYHRHPGERRDPGSRAPRVVLWVPGRARDDGYEKVLLSLPSCRTCSGIHPSTRPADAAQVDPGTSRGDAGGSRYLMISPNSRDGRVPIATTRRRRSKPNTARNANPSSNEPQKPENPPRLRASAPPRLRASAPPREPIDARTKKDAGVNPASSSAGFASGDPPSGRAPYRGLAGANRVRQ
jgi:hypothetical protein